MKYRTFGHTLVVRLERGEEIVSTLKDVCLKNSVRAASVNAIGAVRDVTLRFYHIDKKEYRSETFSGDFEICSLSGNVSVLDDEPQLHLHIVIGDDQFVTHGGHLDTATVSVTCEAFITILDGSIERAKDEETGLNVWNL